VRRLNFFVREALTNIRGNRTTTLIAIATTAFTLACFGVFLLLYLNLKRVANSLENDIQVIIYLADGQSPQAVTDLQRRLKAEPEVATLRYISKEQALADFRTQYPAEHQLLQGLGENPLPASLVVTMAPRFRSPEAVKRWAERLNGIPGVAQVQYDRDWIENLSAVLGFVELAAAGVGIILSAASVTIIASTIRLTLYARRDEVEIMRLIGATGAFIRVPYVLEGAVLGALGGAFSLALLRGGFEFFKLQLGGTGRLLGIESNFGFFPFQVSLAIVLIGLMLGCSGSLVSLMEFGRTRA